MVNHVVEVEWEGPRTVRLTSGVEVEALPMPGGAWERLQARGMELYPDPEPPKKEEPIKKVPEPVPTPAPMPPDAMDPRKRGAALVEQAETLSRGGQGAKALQLCREAVRVDPANHAARGLGSRILFANGEYAEAAAEARDAIRLNANEPAYWMTLGDAYYRQARILSTRYRRRAKKNPADPEAAALQQRRDKLIADARAAYIQVTRLRPKP